MEREKAASTGEPASYETEGCSRRKPKGVMRFNSSYRFKNNNHAWARTIASEARVTQIQRPLAKELGGEPRTAGEECPFARVSQQTGCFPR